MKGITYKLRIKGLKTRSGTIPLIVLKDISESILDGSERSLRLAIAGASARGGRRSPWLLKSLELTFTGISEGSTVLEIEAPRLGDTAPDLVQRQDFWYSLPNSDDTAVTLLAQSVKDATSESRESEHYDSGILDSLLSFEDIIDNYITGIEIESEDRPEEKFSLGRNELEKINKRKSEIPEPKAVIISGIFNLIEHAQRRFQLSLKDDTKIPGKADSSLVSAENMRALWGKEVTIKGNAHFKPSGKMRFIEAQIVKPFQEGEQIFQIEPELITPRYVLEELSTTRRAKSPLKEVWGQWPGEESIEEILDTLREISTENQ